MKLSSGQKHLLKLMAREQINPSGWAKVSAPVLPLIESLPAELFELRKNDDGTALARLTREGDALIAAMEYL